jgi:sugar phosphate isomerase/epimerase
MRQEMIKLRERLVGPRLEAVKKSLQQLMDYAAQLKIKLGLENRYHFIDIPSINEMGDLLNLSDETHLGFIYDVGHAQAMDRLGFYPHEDWLTRYSPRMIGCHLHDVLGLTDHLAPGRGEIDFKKIASYLPKNAFKTMELMPSVSLAQVKGGLNHLVEAGCTETL